MALTTGTEGIKQKDYRVYIGTLADSAATLASYIASKTKTTFASMVATMSELGECRADSIEVNTDKGDTIEGNTQGEIVLNKAGTFAAELINTTVANIEALEALDGVSVVVALYELNTHTQSGTGSFKTAIVIPSAVISYSESIKGSDSIRSTVNITKNTPKVGDFRILADLDQA